MLNISSNHLQITFLIRLWKINWLVMCCFTSFLVLCKWSHLPAKQTPALSSFSSIIVFLSVTASIKGSPCQDKYKAVLFKIFNSKFMLHAFLSLFSFFAVLITVILGRKCTISPMDHLLRWLFSQSVKLINLHCTYNNKIIIIYPNHGSFIKLKIRV